MTQKDQLKIMRKGFRIIRSDQFRKVIKVKTKEHPEGWLTLEKDFLTNRALNERVKELLKCKMTVED